MAKERDDFVDQWKKLWKPDLDALGGFNGATCDPTRVDSKVVEWAKRNCPHHKPHFIKIINNNAANGRQSQGYKSKIAVKLTVPTPFLREHFRELNRVVTLENDEGKTWKVSFGEINAHPCWQQGWRRLAVDLNLKPGEVIVFVLVGNSRFHFTRFDKHGNILSEKGSHHNPPLNYDDTPSVEQTLITTHSASAPGLKRRRLCKVGDILSKAANPNDESARGNNNDQQHCEEAESTSTVGDS